MNQNAKLNLHGQTVRLRDGVAVTLRVTGYLPLTDDRLYEAKGYAQVVTLTGRELELNAAA